MGTSNKLNLNNTCNIINGDAITFLKKKQTAVSDWVFDFNWRKHFEWAKWFVITASSLQDAAFSTDTEWALFYTACFFLSHISYERPVSCAESLCLTFWILFGHFPDKWWARAGSSGVHIEINYPFQSSFHWLRYMYGLAHAIHHGRQGSREQPFVLQRLIKMTLSCSSSAITC